MDVAQLAEDLRVLLDRLNALPYHRVGIGQPALLDQGAGCQQVALGLLARYVNVRPAHRLGQVGLVGGKIGLPNTRVAPPFLGSACTTGASRSIACWAFPSSRSCLAWATVSSPWAAPARANTITAATQPVFSWHSILLLLVM